MTVLISVKKQNRAEMPRRHRMAHLINAVGTVINSTNQVKLIVQQLKASVVDTTKWDTTQLFVVAKIKRQLFGKLSKTIKMVIVRKTAFSSAAFKTIHHQRTGGCIFRLMSDLMAEI